MVGYLDHNQVKVEYQGHGVKVTFVKLIILTAGPRIVLLQPTTGINMIIKVKVISRSSSFPNQIVSVWISFLKKADVVFSLIWDQGSHFFVLTNSLTFPVLSPFLTLFCSKFLGVDFSSCLT